MLSLRVDAFNGKLSETVNSTYMNEVLKNTEVKIYQNILKLIKGIQTKGTV